MNRLNYKLLNILIILLIIISLLYLFTSYSTSLSLIRNIITPIILSFFLAFSFYPIIKCLNKRFSYNISCIIFISIFLIISTLSFYFLYNVLKEEFLNAFLDIEKFIKNNPYFNFNINNYLNLNLVFHSYSYFIEIVLILVLTIYFLFNIEKIRNYLLKYNIVKTIDKDLFCFYKGFYLIVIIESFEHLILYFIIGHPYFLLIAILSIITSLIPIIGNLILNIFALISAYFISDSLFIMTSIILIVLPIVNNYLIEPKVYNKTLNISFISVILSCFIFGSLFGLLGVILSIPFYIIVRNLYMYYKKKEKN